MTLGKPLLWITALATIISIPQLGQAQTCVSTKDCPRGMTCQADSTTPTPTPACPPGAEAECPPVTQPSAPSMTCQPAPCQVDADCGQGMVCHSQTTTVCTGGAAAKCDPNTTCTSVPSPTVPTCTDTTTSQCVYTWDLPCNADADCGDGFVCQPSTMGSCSGSGSSTGGTDTGTASSGTGGGSGSGELSVPPPLPAFDAGVPTAVVCTTTTSFPGSCQAKVTSCNVDSDCPSIWTCVASSVSITIGTAPSPTDAGAAPISTPPTTTSTPISTATATSTATTAKTCQSPYSYPPRTVGLTGGTGTSQSADNGASPDAGAPTKGATTATPPSPTVAGGGENSTGTQTTAATTGGGCVVGAGALPVSPAFLLGLLGAVGLLFRRRNRS